MKARPTKQEITQQLMAGRNCAQCVLGQFAQLVDYDQEETDKMAACFGGGMLMGQTCGAVTGALVAIGLACDDGKEAEGKAAAFEAAFKGRFGSTMCRELLGYDLGDPTQLEAARASGKLIEYCPIPVEGAIEILEELLEN